MPLPAVHTPPSAPFRLELRDRAPNRPPGWQDERDVLVSHFQHLGAQDAHTALECAELVGAATHADELVRLAVLASQWGIRWLVAPGNTQTQDGGTFVMFGQQHYEQVHRAIREASEDGVEWTPVLDFLSGIPKFGFGIGAVRRRSRILEWAAEAERTDDDIHALLSFAHFHTHGEVLARASHMDAGDIMEYARVGAWTSLERGLSNEKLSNTLFVPVLAAAVDLIARDSEAQHAACRSFAVAASNGSREVHLTQPAVAQLVALYRTPGSDQTLTWAARLLVGQTANAAIYTSIARGGRLKPSDVPVALCNPAGSVDEWCPLLQLLTDGGKSTARRTRKRPPREPLRLSARATVTLLEYVVQSGVGMLRLAPDEWAALVRHPSCTTALCLQILNMSRSVLVRVAASECVQFLGNAEVRALLAHSKPFSVAKVLAMTSTDPRELRRLVTRQVRRDPTLVPELMAVASDALVRALPASLLTPALESSLLVSTGLKLLRFTGENCTLGTPTCRRMF